MKKQELNIDYYLSNIILPKPRRIGTIGKYGKLRLNYMEEHHKAEVMLMRVNNELTSYLLDIDDECRERLDVLIKQMAEKEGVTEELKTRNKMKWIQKMNNIKNCAEEIAYNEIIFI